MTRLHTKKDGEVTPHALVSAAESQIAFAKLFVAVAQSSYAAGEIAFAEHSKTVAESAFRAILELLKDLGPWAERIFADEIDGLRASINEL